MADSGHPPAELHERLLICRTIKLNAGALGGHRRCCHAQMRKNAQNKPQIARLILCVRTTLQVYCNLFLTFCVLVPKYRRKVIYGKLRKDIGKILRTLCDYKHVEIIEAHAMPDHIHMLVSIPPKLAVADFMGYLKGKSTLMIFERHANLKYKYGRRVFWAKGYYVNTVGGNEAKIRKYIQEQEFNDQMCDQLSFKEYEDPFKNVADFDDDDSPEVPTDSMRK